MSQRVAFKHNNKHSCLPATITALEAFSHPCSVQGRTKLSPKTFLRQLLNEKSLWIYKHSHRFFKVLIPAITWTKGGGGRTAEGTDSTFSEVVLLASRALRTQSAA